MYPFTKSPFLKNLKPDHKMSFIKEILYLLLIMVASDTIASFLVGGSLIGSLATSMFELTSKFVSGEISQENFISLYEEIATKIANSEFGVLLSLFSTVTTIGACIIFQLVILKKPLSEYGLTPKPKKGILDSLFGILLGVVLFSLVIFLIILLGSGEISVSSTGFLSVLPFLFAFLIQGASEEILIHGFLFTGYLKSSRRVYFSVVLTSLVFALLHVSNDGFSYLPFINLFLFATFMGLLTLRTGTLYPAIFLHGIWNFLEGNIFGTSVSGILTLPSVFKVTFTSDKYVTNGGSFGPEGGLACTLVLLVSLFLIIFLPKLKKDNEITE